MTAAQDWQWQPSSHADWAGWMASGFAMILDATTLEDAKKIATLRLGEFVDPVTGFQGFPHDVMVHWRLMIKERTDV